MYDKYFGASKTLRRFQKEIRFSAAQGAVAPRLSTRPESNAMPQSSDGRLQKEARFQDKVMLRALSGRPRGARQILFYKRASVRQIQQPAGGASVAAA